MTREQLIAHMVNDHQLHRESFESVPLEDLILSHAVDHESVISVEKGFADHRHSEYLEVDGIPAFR